MPRRIFTANSTSLKSAFEVLVWAGYLTTEDASVVAQERLQGGCTEFTTQIRYARRPKIDPVRGAFVRHARVSCVPYLKECGSRNGTYGVANSP